MQTYGNVVNSLISVYNFLFLKNSLLILSLGQSLQKSVADIQVYPICGGCGVHRFFLSEGREV
jgi:hypothetical protein